MCLFLQEQHDRHTALLQRMTGSAKKQQSDSIRAAERKTCLLAEYAALASKQQLTRWALQCCCILAAETIESSQQEVSENQRQAQEALQSLVSAIDVGGEKAAQRLHELQQQLEADAATRQQHTEAAAAELLDAVKKQLAAFVESQRAEGEKHKLLVQQHLASVKEQHQQQQAAHAAAGVTASSASSAAAAAADAASTKAKDAVQQIFAKTAAITEEHHRQLIAAKEEETAETLQRLAAIRVCCEGSAVCLLPLLLLLLSNLLMRIHCLHSSFAFAAAVLVQ